MVGAQQLQVALSALIGVAEPHESTRVCRARYIDRTVAVDPSRCPTLGPWCFAHRVSAWV